MTEGAALREVPSVEGHLNAASNYRKALGFLPALSTAEKNLLHWVLDSPLDESAEDLLGRSEPALEELRRGATLPTCDWELDSPQ